MKTILQAINLTKTFKSGKIKVPALRGLSLKVNEEEFIAIMGPSGCGKSTLLHLLGGLATPTGGQVLIDGEEISTSKDSVRTDIRRRKIGFVFQRFNLLPTLSAMANLRIAQEIHGNSNSNQEDIHKILRLLGLGEKIHHKPSELSGGEQQRLAIGRAIINKPSILLADEPTGNLDSYSSKTVLNMMQELNQTFSQTILMITHNPEAATVANRVIEMRDGKIISPNTT
ncbi:MAG: ABC transporter ATP-binding protein [Acidobacteriia bacterium]|jgi:putative ABC transport system ATP-binding protein|nr:ABC transporter ATP-binding protein [Terriglobia bacterium]